MTITPNTWQNMGDISPRAGTSLMRNPEIDVNGDFTSEIVETISESTVGGDESRILIRQGEIFLAAKNFASALETVDAKIEGTLITRPNHNGGTDTFEVTSDEGMTELFMAAKAFGSMDPDIESLVKIGVETSYDQEQKFDGEVTVYPSNRSLWAIMRGELDGFDYRPEKVTAGTAAESSSPFSDPTDLSDGPQPYS
jgi:hypothetical protein